MDSKSALPRYGIASLVWCRWSNMTWPAMVSYDPRQAVFFRTTGKNITHYHVQYFGIKAQRGWVRDKDITPLLAGEEKVPQKMKKSLQHDYQVAITEVTRALKVGPKQRKLRFIFNYGSIGKANKTSKLDHKRTKRLPLLAMQESKDVSPCDATACHASVETSSASCSDVSLGVIPCFTSISEDSQSIESASRLPHISSLDMLTPPSTSSETESTDNELVLDTNQRSTTSTLQCDICSGDYGNSLVTCNGHCLRSFHIDCLGLASLPKFSFVCDECILSRSSCYLCHSLEGELITCSHSRCDKQYHMSCAASNKLFQVDSSKQTIVCAMHHCAKCYLGETQCSQPKRSSKLVQCIRCPFALHKSTCLIAGCEMINDSQMVCYQHLVVNYSFPQCLRHLNLNSCLECGETGTLVCCEWCPATYHANCLPEDKRPLETDLEWLCPSCANHDLPTYESVVLCKCGNSKWWPAQVMSVVPDSLLASKPAKGMFLIQFFGTQQYTWTNHGRVIAFTDDGNWVEEMTRKSKFSHQSTKTGKQNALFRKACEEALAVFREQSLLQQQAKSMSADSKTYCHIKRNKYLVPKLPVERETEPCQCTIEDPCSSSSNCINRDLFIECSLSSCPVGDACRNQRIGKQLSADTYPFHTTTRGWGLKSKHDIAQGEFVIEYIGEVLDKSMCLERLKESQEKSVSNFYFLTLESNLVIDASRKSNHARFMNHSCDPNCSTEKWTVNGETRIGLFATRDIPSGAELTFDYQLDCLGNEKKRCLCGADNCSGFIGEKPKSFQEHPSLQQREKKSRLKKKRKTSIRRLRTKFAKTETGHEDECFICKDGGDLLLCDYPACLKVYHLSCLDLDDVPSDSFDCPRHICNVCSSPAVEYCSNCPNSYCTTHCIDKLNSSSQDQPLCYSNCCTQNN